MYALIFGLLLLMVLWVLEYFRHHHYRRQIPEIVHVNGTRGKSSVTRLIAGGLRAGGLRTIAKTTGSAPVLILEDGSEIPIIRYFGANIKEQLRIIRFAARRRIDVMVMECMAVRPEYQWVTEHQMLRSTVGVITNSRLDHLDEMGPGLRNVTLSLCNSLPRKAVAYTSEFRVFPLMQKQAEKKGTQLRYADPATIAEDDMRGFTHVEHRENVALALQVCEHFGVDKQTALSGMYKAIWDIGATEIFEVHHQDKKIFFVHTFAANDPESTGFIIDYIRKIHPHLESVAVVLNTRADRMFRSKQLVQMLTRIEFDALFLIGQQTASIEAYAHKHGLKKNVFDCGWVTGEKMISYIDRIPAKEILLFGIGNIGGNGGIIVKYFKERNKKDV